MGRDPGNQHLFPQTAEAGPLGAVGAAAPGTETTKHIHNSEMSSFIFASSCSLRTTGSLYTVSRLSQSLFAQKKSGNSGRIAADGLRFAFCHDKIAT
jgi:hypothetical protein